MFVACRKCVEYTSRRRSRKCVGRNAHPTSGPITVLVVCVTSTRSYIFEEVHVELRGRLRRRACAYAEATHSMQKNKSGLGRSVVPPLCKSKCSWARYQHPNWSWLLIHLCVSMRVWDIDEQAGTTLPLVNKCAWIAECSYVMLSTLSGRKTRQSHTYSVHLKTDLSSFYSTHRVHDHGKCNERSHGHLPFFLYIRVKCDYIARLTARHATQSNHAIKWAH